MLRHHPSNKYTVLFGLDYYIMSWCAPTCAQEILIAQFYATFFYVFQRFYFFASWRNPGPDMCWVKKIKSPRLFHGHGYRPPFQKRNNCKRKCDGFASHGDPCAQCSKTGCSKACCTVHVGSLLHNKIRSTEHFDQTILRRVKRIRVMQQILCWFIRRDISDGLYENFRSLIALWLEKTPDHIFRAAFRLSRHVFDALVIELAPLRHWWQIKKFLPKWEALLDLKSPRH